MDKMVSYIQFLLYLVSGLLVGPTLEVTLTKASSFLF